jgi:hypothetical protein
MFVKTHSHDALYNPWCSIVTKIAYMGSIFNSLCMIDRWLGGIEYLLFCAMMKTERGRWVLLHLKEVEDADANQE